MEQLRKLGLRIVVYFIFTTIIAISIGLAVSLIIQPGNYINTSTVNMSMDDAPVKKESESMEDFSVTAVPDMLTGLQ